MLVCLAETKGRGAAKFKRMTYPPQVPAVLVAVWQLALGIDRTGQRPDQVTDQNHADHRNRNYIHVAPHPGRPFGPMNPVLWKYSPVDPRMTGRTESGAVFVAQFRPSCSSNREYGHVIRRRLADRPR